MTDSTDTHTSSSVTRKTEKVCSCQELRALTPLQRGVTVKYIQSQVINATVTTLLTHLYIYHAFKTNTDVLLET